MVFSYSKEMIIKELDTIFSRYYKTNNFLDMLVSNNYKNKLFNKNLSI